MFQIDEATAASSLPTPATAGTQGYFTNGNPAGGVPATIVDADWLNMIQQELINIVQAAGEMPSKTTYNQVLLAIKRLVQSQVVLTDTGAANAYVVANTPALTNTTWANSVVQQFIVAHANTGASTFSPDALTAIPIYGLGLQPLQGGELAAGGTAILMKQTITGVNSGNPIAVLLECSGGAQQVAPATQSRHAVNLGQFASLLAQNGYQKLPNGLIVQWGMVGAIAANSSLDVIYPIAFPNSFLSISTIAGALTVGAPQIAGVNSSGTGNQKAGFTAWNSSSSAATQPGGYIALGN